MRNERCLSSHDTHASGCVCHATVASGILRTHLSAMLCLLSLSIVHDTHIPISLLHAVVGSKRPADGGAPGRAHRELRRGVIDGTEGSKGVAPSGAAPVIGAWIAACFPGGVPASEIGIEELIAEAAEAARNDFGVEAAIEWADGYQFPAEFVESDVRCLQAAQLDFRSMVARRLKILSKDRLSHKPRR